MENKFELHPDLQDASLKKACKMADGLVKGFQVPRLGPVGRESLEKSAADLSYMLEYLRLNFDLVPKK